MIENGRLNINNHEGPREFELWVDSAPNPLYIAAVRLALRAVGLIHVGVALL
jgi:hypothetical protein